MSNFTYFNTLILCVINKIKLIHPVEGHFKVKAKYLYPFKFYVAILSASRWFAFMLVFLLEFNLLTYKFRFQLSKGLNHSKF